MDIELLLEANRRGLLAKQHDPELLIEAHKRGMFNAQEETPPPPPPLASVGGKELSRQNQMVSLPSIAKEAKENPEIAAKYSPPPQASDVVKSQVARAVIPPVMKALDVVARPARAVKEMAYEPIRQTYAEGETLPGVEQQKAIFERIKSGTATKNDFEVFNRKGKFAEPLTQRVKKTLLPEAFGKLEGEAPETYRKLLKKADINPGKLPVWALDVFADPLFITPGVGEARYSVKSLTAFEKVGVLSKLFNITDKEAARMLLSATTKLEKEAINKAIFTTIKKSPSILKAIADNPKTGMALGETILKESGTHLGFPTANYIAPKAGAGGGELIGLKEVLKNVAGGFQLHPNEVAAIKNFRAGLIKKGSEKEATSIVAEVFGNTSLLGQARVFGRSEEKPILEKLKRMFENEDLGQEYRNLVRELEQKNPIIIEALKRHNLLHYKNNQEILPSVAGVENFPIDISTGTIPGTQPVMLDSRGRVVDLPWQTHPVVSELVKAEQLIANNGSPEEIKGIVKNIQERAVVPDEWLGTDPKLFPQKLKDDIEIWREVQKRESFAPYLPEDRIPDVELYTPHNIIETSPMTDIPSGRLEGDYDVNRVFDPEHFTPAIPHQITGTQARRPVARAVETAPISTELAQEGVKIAETTPTTTQIDPLLQEARKYKTAALPTKATPDTPTPQMAGQGLPPPPPSAPPIGGAAEELPNIPFEPSPSEFTSAADSTRTPRFPDYERVGENYPSQSGIDEQVVATQARIDALSERTRTALESQHQIDYQRTINRGLGIRANPYNREAVMAKRTQKAMNKVKATEAKLNKEIDVEIKDIIEKNIIKPSPTKYKNAGVPFMQPPLADPPMTFLRSVKEVYDNTIAASKTILRNSSPTGAKMIAAFDEIAQNAAQRASKWTREALFSHKLNLNEKYNAADVVEGFATATNSKTSAVAQTLKNHFTEVGSEATERGIQVWDGDGLISFKGKEDYFPHWIPVAQIARGEKWAIREASNTALSRGWANNISDAERLVRDFGEYFRTSGGNRAFLHDMVKSGRVRTIAEAENVLRTFIKPKTFAKEGHLEYSRLADLPFYVRDLDVALPKFYSGVARRLEEIRVFGQKGEKLFRWIDDIQREGGNHLLATRLSEELTRRIPVGDTKFAAALSYWQDFQVMSKMGLSALTNLGQSVNTTARTNLTSFLGAVKDSFTKNGRDFATDSGAMFEGITKDMIASIGGNKQGSSLFLKYQGFNAVERFNRIVASNAGRRYALQLFSDLVKNPSDKFAMRRLRQIIPGADIRAALNRGALTEKNLLDAGFTATRDTQFLYRVQDLPLKWRDSEIMKLATQFKSFSVQQKDFIKEFIIGEALKGNFKPVIYFGISTQVAGEVIQDLKGQITGRDRSKMHPLMRMLDNFLLVGGVGIFGDLLNSASYGKSALAAWFTGPVGADLVDGLYAIINAVEGHPKQLGKEIIKSAPGVVGKAIHPVLAIPTSIVAKTLLRPEKEASFSLPTAPPPRQLTEREKMIEELRRRGFTDDDLRQRGINIDK